MTDTGASNCGTHASSSPGAAPCRPSRCGRLKELRSDPLLALTVLALVAAVARITRSGFPVASMRSVFPVRMRSNTSPVTTCTARLRVHRRRTLGRNLDDLVQHPRDRIGLVATNAAPFKDQLLELHADVSSSDRDAAGDDRVAGLAVRRVADQMVHDRAVVPEDKIPDFPAVSVGELRTGAVLYGTQNELRLVVWSGQSISVVKTGLRYSAFRPVSSWVRMAGCSVSGMLGPKALRSSGLRPIEQGRSSGSVS